VVFVLGAPAAELAELQTGLERLLVLARIVIHAVAGRALQFDEIFLGHRGIGSMRKY
jgi:hypothetical protein